jgi:hypothetical protein
MRHISKVITIALAFVLFSSHIYAQSKNQKKSPPREYRKVFHEGHVWTLTMVKVKPGMTEDYLRALRGSLRKMEDEAVRQGLMVSYKILVGSSANDDDWDVLLMEEYQSLASLDGIDDRMRPIQEKFVGDQDELRNVMISRSEMRSIYGDKMMREIVFD